MTNPVYLHTGFLNHRFQRVFVLCMGIAYVGGAVYEYLWRQSYITAIFILAISIYWFRSAYRYYKAGEEIASRVEASSEGLFVRQIPYPTTSKKPDFFQWEHIRQIKIDGQSRQMTILLSDEAPQVNRRQFINLATLSKKKIQAVKELISPYVAEDKILSV